MLRNLMMILGMLLPATVACRAQDSRRGIPFGFTAGFHMGSRSFFEGGIGTAQPLGGGSCSSEMGFGGYALSALYSPGLVPQVGMEGTMWFDTPILAAGLNLAYYTNFTEATLRFKPEIGLGLVVARVVYSFSIPIVNTGYSGIGTHELALRTYLPVYKPR